MAHPILHVTTRTAWNAAVAAGEYRTPDLETTGFIHFCDPPQLDHVLHTYFLGQGGLVMLQVDPGRLKARLVYENSFPHLNGPLNLDAVLQVTPIF
ncbi:MAG: DUF952 domain-containing protein [Bryobacterales bacterium]|nr:DUF952 domain-containing protein [Bryobacterales bacterium]